MSMFCFPSGNQPLGIPALERPTLEELEELKQSDTISDNSPTEPAVLKIGSLPLDMTDEERIALIRNAPSGTFLGWQHLKWVMEQSIPLRHVAYPGLIVNGRVLVQHHTNFAWFRIFCFWENLEKVVAYDYDLAVNINSLESQRASQ